MKIAWTGHRRFRTPEQARLKVVEAVPKLFRAEFILGGALGVDTWVMKEAMRWRIPFSLYLPFPLEIFTAHWSEFDQLYLKAALFSAKEIRIVQQYYRLAGYHKRDRLMVDDSDEVFAVWDGRLGGGTYATMEYARQTEKPLTILQIEEPWA